ncbi:GNAT family N-acetyltransferase [uncultured Reyranella sp.]|uniref:GNAT family N-acetyltransferase n=1 Tax=uncultured Reyranella sp. TaxID=735512 RepID=UPI002600B2FA|nr:GNAT family N-acetyltransferase [uncultured Reyranella sp.]
MTDRPLTLIRAEPEALSDFKRALQTAFSLAVADEPGVLDNGPIPSDGDLDAAIAAPGALTLEIVQGGQRVGGAVVVIDERTHHNRLDLFYIVVGHHGRGLGRKAWMAIEAMFPETLLWETQTPYFEKRNIHFYINVCGFKAVEFFNERHSDPHHAYSDDGIGDEMFRFEKEMRVPIL